MDIVLSDPGVKRSVISALSPAICLAKSYCGNNVVTIFNFSFPSFPDFPQDIQTTENTAIKTAVIILFIFDFTFLTLSV